MSLGRRISNDVVGNNFVNVIGFDQLFDHGIDPAATLLVPPFSIFSLNGQELTTDLPPELSSPLKSIRFRGNPDKWELANNLDLGPADFTLALFFRKVDAECDADAAVASKGQTGTGEWAVWIDMVGTGSDTIGFSAGGAAFDLESATGVVNDELWHHVAVTRVGTLISLYVDGSLEDTATNSTDLTNSELLRFGVKNTGSDFFGGSLTAGLLYFTGLNAAQVANLAAGNVQAGFVSHFRFAVADILSAPAGNHGTLNGGAFFDATTLAGQLQGKTDADEILAISHDGVDDTVTFPAVTLVGEFTAALFFKPDDLTLQTLIGDVVTDRIQIGSATTILVVVGAGTLTFTVPTMDTDWHTVVVARDASDNIRVFLDNVESTTGALVDAADATFAKIGAHGAAATDPFDGHTAKVVLEPREWSATERTAYFDDGSSTSAFTDFRSNTGLIEDAEPGAPAGTVSTQFDGQNGFMEIVSPTLPLTAFSVACRFRMKEESIHRFVAARDIAGGNFGWYLGTAGTPTKVEWLIDTTSGSNTRVSSTSVNDGVFHTAIGTWDGSAVKLFVDGVEESQSTQSGTIAAPPSLRIGRGTAATTRFQKGNIRDIQIWNRAITQLEVDDYEVRVGVPDGLVLSYPLATEANLVEDNIGDFADTAQDSIGSADGTLINYTPDPNLGWVQAVPAQLVDQQTSSLSFDGVNQLVDVSTGAPTFLASAAFSLSGWVKLDTLGARVALIGDRASTNDGFLVAIDNILELQINGVAHVGTTALVADRWYHVSATRAAAGTINIFLDGVDDTSGTPTNTADFATGNFGAQNSTVTAANFLDGELADVRTYNVLLNPADISTLSGGGTITPTATTQQKFDDARIFETMQAWSTDAYADTGRFGTSDVARGIPFNDSDYVELVTISATNTTGILSASLVAPVGQRFIDGIPGTGVRLRQTGPSTASIDIQSVVSFEFAGIEIDGNGQAGGNLVTLSGAAHDVHHNLLHDIINTTVAAGGIELKTGTTGSTVHTNFIFALTTTTGACTGILSAVVCDIAANSILGIVASTGGDGAGISVSALAVARNNVSAGSDLAYVGTFGTGTDSNVASDTTAPGTNPVQNAAAVDLFKDITPGSEDLHIKNLDSPSLGAGVSLMNTGIIGIHEDIDFAARPTSGVWDAGADRGTGLSEGVKALATQGAWGISIGFSIGMGG